MNKCIFPGTFDPVTLGHIDVIKRAAEVFDEVVVAICDNSAKTALFSKEARLTLMRDAVSYMDKVKVVICDGLLAGYAAENSIGTIVKGVRNTNDFCYEYDLYEINAGIAGNNYSHPLDTFLIPSQSKYAFLSSTVVRELIKHGEKYDFCVPNPELLSQFTAKQK